jgi:hemolysin activation/secretion protein
LSICDRGKAMRQVRCKRAPDAPKLAIAGFAAVAGLLCASANEAHALSEDEADANANAAAACVSGCVLLGVTLDGATLFPLDQLAPAYSGYLAREVAATDLSRIAEAVTEHYRARGYFLSRAYVSGFDDGLARISVMEGYIAEIVIEGSGGELIRPYFHTREPIMRLTDLETRLAYARDVPGVRVSSRMEPDLDDARRHRLVITAELERVEGFVSLDNRGVEAIGPLQAYARATFNSALRGRDQLSFAVFATPADPEELDMAEVAYSSTLVTGDRVYASASLTHMEIGQANSAGMSGENHFISFGYERPLQRTRRGGLWLGARFDAAHLEADWTGGAGYVDEVRAGRVSLRGFLDADGRASTVFVQVSLGLDFLGASDDSHGGLSRQDADAHFAKWDFMATHTRSLPRGLSLYGAVAGQWSNEALLQSEEFSVGGVPFGRAYAYGEISGERALAGLAELRWDAPAEFDPFTLQTYAFLDAARVWNEGADESAAIASAGIGVRVGFEDRISAGWELARPLEDAPIGQVDRDWRQFVTLQAAY